MYKLLSAIKNFFVREEDGATMLEYGLMVSLIAIVSLGAVTAMGLGVQSLFSGIVALL
jgi:pilus assembly protein Flp/PilA